MLLLNLVPKWANIEVEFYILTPTIIKKMIMIIMIIIYFFIMAAIDRGFGNGGY